MVFFFLTKRPPYLFGIPGDNFVFKIQNKSLSPGRRKNEETMSPRGENIRRSAVFIPLDFECMWQLCNETTNNEQRTTKQQQRMRTAIRAVETAILLTRRLQLLAVLVRGAALGSDEPPKVKQELGVLSGLWTLSFGVRGAIPLLLVTRACKHPQVLAVLCFLFMCLLVDAVETRHR